MGHRLDLNTFIRMHSGFSRKTGLFATLGQLVLCSKERRGWWGRKGGGRGGGGGGGVRGGGGGALSGGNPQYFTTLLHAQHGGRMINWTTKMLKWVFPRQIDSFAIFVTSTLAIILERHRSRVRSFISFTFTGFLAETHRTFVISQKLEEQKVPLVYMFLWLFLVLV